LGHQQYGNWQEQHQFYQPGQPIPFGPDVHQMGHHPMMAPPHMYAGPGGYFASSAKVNRRRPASSSGTQNKQRSSKNRNRFRDQKLIASTSQHHLNASSMVLPPMMPYGPYPHFDAMSSSLTPMT